MTEDEKDKQEFEAFFKEGCFHLRMALVPPNTNVGKFIEGLMQESYLASRKPLREENEKLKMIVEKQDGYNKLLVDEINDLVGLATVHGWQSTRYEQGEKFRNELSRLRGESPDAGGKSLQRGKRHFSSMPE